MDISYKHRNLFEAGARALQAVEGTENLYRCPICCSDYDERAIKKNSAPDYTLTLEHAPPESVGGKVVALTCKKCNNGLGSRLDSQIASRENHFRFLIPQKPNPTPFPAKIVLNENPSVSANIQIVGKLHSGMKIRAGHNNKPSNLSSTQKMIAAAYAAGKEVQLVLRVPKYDERLAELGFLKSAFLCLFAKFGYTYALCPSARYVAKGFMEKQKINVVKVEPIVGHEEEILVSENTGTCLVGFGEFAVVCPWINSHPEKYAAACEAPTSFLGNYKSVHRFKMPVKLEAILDHR